MWGFRRLDFADSAPKLVFDHLLDNAADAGAVTLALGLEVAGQQAVECRLPSAVGSLLGDTVGLLLQVAVRDVEWETEYLTWEVTGSLAVQTYQD
jgi:hypothetical protein